jgi:hypothetical protein
MRAGLLALTLVLGLLLGTLSGAAAQTSTLPTFKLPASAKFTLAGTTMVGPQTIATSATGMLAGDRFQQDFVASPAGGSPITVNMIQVVSMFYYRITGNPQWQMIDLTTTPGNIPNIQSPIPNLNGYTPNGGQRTYEAAGNARQGGSESINGVTTTKYEADVDVAKLFTSIGTPAAQAAQAAAVSKMTLTLWIDAGQVLRQQRVLLNSKAAGPGGVLLDVVVDFTITYSDIGAPVTILAPGETTPGMPRTGAADLNGSLALLVLALLCLLAGRLLWRRGEHLR